MSFISLSCSFTLTLSPKAAKKYNNSWVTNFTKPSVVNVFYVDHKGHRVWRNYERYLKDKGNQQYMWHGTTRACNIGDDNTQLYACHRTDCGVCNILRNTLDPTRASTYLRIALRLTTDLIAIEPSSMYGIGAYVAPNSSSQCLSFCNNFVPCVLRYLDRICQHPLHQERITCPVSGRRLVALCGGAWQRVPRLHR